MSQVNANGFSTVLITGGAGYVGSALTPHLLERGYRVKVLDVFWYGADVFGDCNHHPNLERIKLDMRDVPALTKHLSGVAAVLHLACISNDPSFEMDPGLGKSINYDCFAGLLQAAIDARVKRFIYASSSSIYGVKADPNVVEDAVPEPLTDYSKFKLLCERVLLEHPQVHGMERVIVRPATVCGYAPRLRLDLVVNILTINALVHKKIKVFGGDQKRPNICIKDMVATYEALLDAAGKKIDGEAFNAGTENHTVKELALLIRESLGNPELGIEFVPSADNRSYHINSDKIRQRLGVAPRWKIADAVRDLADAYEAGKMKDPMTNPLYYNIKTMQKLQVK